MGEWAGGRWEKVGRGTLRLFQPFERKLGSLVPVLFLAKGVEIQVFGVKNPVLEDEKVPVRLEAREAGLDGAEAKELGEAAVQGVRSARRVRHVDSVAFFLRHLSRDELLDGALPLPCVRVLYRLVCDRLVACLFVKSVSELAKPVENAVFDDLVVLRRKGGKVRIW